MLKECQARDLLNLGEKMSERGFELNLEPLEDEATATLTLGGEKVEIAIKKFWDAMGEAKSNVSSPEYVNELKPLFEELVGKPLSLWATEVIYNAVSNWVTNLYKKK